MSDDFVLMNFRNGRKIIGRKKKDVINWNSMYGFVKEITVIVKVRVQPNHLSLNYFHFR